MNGCGCFFFQAEDGIRYHCVTGVQTCALPISLCRSFGNLRTAVQIGHPTSQDTPRFLPFAIPLFTAPPRWMVVSARNKIGRASCRERGEMSGVGVSWRGEIGHPTAQGA